MVSESTKSIDEKIMERLKSDEPKILRVLELYYTNFDTDRSITFQGAAAKAKVNPAYIVSYMFYRKDIGMPSDREEAVKYLANLRKHINEL